MIPYTRHSVDAYDENAVLTVLRSDRLTQGPTVRHFERSLIASTKAADVVCFSSGTAALHAMLWVVSTNDRRNEVITSPLTFAATVNAIIYAGLKPVLVDVDHRTLNINPKAVEAALTPYTLAVLAVDYAGLPCDYDELRAVCQKQDLLLLADSCHSFGAEYKGRPIGSIADMTAFSFHPSKLITSAEGGAVACKTMLSAAALRRFRNHGRDDDGNAIQPGYNYRMSDIHAALGVSQLRKATMSRYRRWSIAGEYDRRLRVKGVDLPTYSMVDRTHAWHLYALRVPAEKRDEFRAVLLNRGIETQVHYKPIHQHRRFMHFVGDSPIVDREAKRLVSIPLFPSMTAGDVTTVISAVFDTASDIL